MLHREAFSFAKDSLSLFLFSGDLSKFEDPFLTDKQMTVCAQEWDQSSGRVTLQPCWE